MRANRITALGAVLSALLAAAAVFAVLEAGEIAEAQVGERLVRTMGFANGARLYPVRDTVDRAVDAIGEHSPG